MATQVCTGASLKCSFGTTPSTFSASSADVSATDAAGVITDVAQSNVPPFGLCTSASNPAVASAQGAPQPCVPVLTPWSPGASDVKIDGVHALDDSCQCQCAWAGVITVESAGQTSVSVT
ncbi:MAG TPA: DUF4280 domain-containing protein [Gaiellaceae bacterium]|nr:DUF4280 domain-containing protein [Gaiellaceae bacterium]